MRSTHREAFFGNIKAAAVNARNNTLTYVSERTLVLAEGPNSTQRRWRPRRRAPVGPTHSDGEIRMGTTGRQTNQPLMPAIRIHITGAHLTPRIETIRPGIPARDAQPFQFMMRDTNLVVDPNIVGAPERMR